MSKDTGALDPDAFIVNKDVLYVKKNILKTTPNVSSVGNSHSREIKTNYTRADGEVVIDGNTNCFIVLGADRNAGVLSGFGGKGHSGAAAIDIVAGHMGARPVDRIFDTKIQTDKNFIDDAARVYISQKSNIDEYFSIPKTLINIGTTTFDLDDTYGKSAVAAKADNIRLIARENVKIVTFHRGFNSLSRKVTDGGIDIFAGCNVASNDPAYDLQPMVKGNNLIKLLQQMIKLIQNTQTTVASFMKIQQQINDAVSQHTHQSGNAGMLTSAVVGGNISSANFKLMTETLPSIIKNYIDQSSFDGDFFSTASPDYINSLWNRVN